ncbi:MAG: hypothetical protein DBX59_04050 [Bacillota bacterium]|nr:MAG: hypothetical protein DBX59_04050 [Bacillota bacterium]
MRKDKRNNEEDKLRGQLKAQSEEYEIILAEQKNVILELKEEIKQLSAELDAYKNRENLIGITLKATENQALEMKKLSEQEYAAELRRLAEFKKRWNAYFAALRAGDFADIQNGERLTERLNAVLLKNANDKEKVLAMMAETADLKPAAAEQVAAAQTFALDMSQVLNPGELDLEELCKEMGLMEE